MGNGNEQVNILRLRMRNRVCYQNKLYRWPRIDERIEYVYKMNNKIKLRDVGIGMNRVYELD